MSHRYNERFLVAQILDERSEHPIVDWRTTSSDVDCGAAVDRLRARLSLGADEPLYCAVWALSDRVEAAITAAAIARVVRPEYVVVQPDVDTEYDDAPDVDRFLLVPYAD